MTPSIICLPSRLASKPRRAKALSRGRLFNRGKHMLQKPKCPVIALEEHYWDRELAADAQGVKRNPNINSRLLDTGEIRLKEMDEAGIDIQVLSHGAPSAQKLSGPDAAALTARVNDRLAAFV